MNRCKKLGLDLIDDSSDAADEGTAAHSIRELCLDIGLDPYEFVGTDIGVNGKTFTCDEDMAAALQPGIDRVREFEGIMFIEFRVDITPWTGLDESGNPQGGTLDCGIVGEDEICINDLKFGKGIPVEAVGNTQIRLYALGFYEQVAKFLTKATKFRLMIDQPRHGRGGGEWVQTLEELQAFGEYVKERAALTFDPNAPCTPSKDACQWCAAAKVDGACPEYEAWNLEFCDIEFENLDDYDEFGIEIETPDVEGLTVARKRAIYDHLPVIRKFLTRVEQSVAEAVRSGQGYLYGKKLVAGRRTHRKHIDEDQSAEWLHEKGYSDEQIFTKKLKTPAMLDKVCGKGKFPKEMVKGGQPKPAIVPIEDARPALLVTTDFDNLDESFEDFDD
ncbi:CRISPR/Cas system-associated protein [Rhizobium phage RHph_X2_30]|nr:CRISPR/Cas system-associated protein [Rhizobium phage RHph_X2_30]